jgi:hypothetical protein
MKGVDFDTKRMKPSPVIGRLYQSNFDMYDEKNIADIDARLKEDANNFDFRKRADDNTGGECLENDSKKWGYTWCNNQLHLGDNVGFENVEAVLAPRWIVDNPLALAQVSDVDDDLLRRMVTNRMPTFPDGTANLLNGKFVLYGTTDPDATYGYMWQTPMPFDPKAPELFRQYYPWLALERHNQRRSTFRKPYGGSSARLALSEDAFEDVEKIYMGMLVKDGYAAKGKIGRFTVSKTKIGAVPSPLPSSTQTQELLVYVIPEKQPPFNVQAMLYGGYHITIFPTHTLPADYSLREAMVGFPMTSTPWRLPKDVQVRDKFIYIESPTITKLIDHLLKPNGVWERKWLPTHLTLGSNDQSLVKSFMDEDVWYVQLVEKRKQPDGSSRYIWLKRETVRLYEAV